MVKHNQHIIARQVLELEVPSVTRAPEIQEAVVQRLRDHTMTEMETLFDRLGPPESVVRLERLEIELGDLGGDDWQEQFGSRLVAQLAESLKKATTERRETSTPPDSDLGTPFEQYLYFLQNGRLPWWGETPSADWPQPLLQALDSPQWHALKMLLSHNEYARQRMIHAIDDELLSTLLSRHAGLHGILQLFTLWRPATLPHTLHTSWRTQFWLAVLEPATTTGEPSRGIEIMRSLLRLRRAFVADAPPIHGPVAHGTNATQPLPEPWHNWLATALHDADSPGAVHADESISASLLSKDASSGPSATTIEAAGTQTERLPSQDAAPSPFMSGTHVTGSHANHKKDHTSTSIVHPSNKDTATSRNSGQPVLSDEAVYLNGAGCIILHPFLEELFRSNDLLDGHDFCDEASRGRAVHLLARLTFGREAIPEYELLLPKLLCGMAWEEPLELVELSDKEHAACDELLHAVLRHWNALKSNSIDWMREQFFLRSAKLEQLDSNWRLTVERRAQDVLLDQVPWGLGVIELPWMNEKVFLNWTK